MSGPLPLIAAAVLWGAVTGALLPRAAYRFSVPAGEAWRSRCPGGHPLRGWLGRGRCARCATATRGEADTSDGPEGTRAPTHTPSAAPPAHTPSAAPPAHAPEAAPASHAPDVVPPAHAPEAAPASHAPDVVPPAHAPDAAPASHAPDVVPPPHAPDIVPPAYARSAAPVAATALVCAALAAATGPRPELAAWLLLAPVGVLLAVVDLRVRRLPDVLTLPFAGAALLLLGAAALLPGHAGHWPTALYGALALGGGYFVLFLVNPSGMGFGDVKLAPAAGAALGWYGWPTVLLGTFAGFLCAALYAGALVAVRRAGRKTAIAFGPFLIAGACAGVLLGAHAA
ncbi:A24 family peptidase [Streptomyces sp. NPDC047017]|uniref:prepilin peptidase n=1 Tax=Streptomyces sp. NPDC047017 TaxID=3155024 RepID=UPI0033C2C7EA